MNKEILKLNETLTKVTNMIKQTEICSYRSPIPKPRKVDYIVLHEIKLTLYYTCSIIYTKVNWNYSELTKNTFQAVEIDETQYFDRDICPGKCHKL